MIIIQKIFRFIAILAWSSFLLWACVDCVIRITTGHELPIPFSGISELCFVMGYLCVLVYTPAIGWANTIVINIQQDGFPVFD
ncbi:MAG: hypothetical protein QG566_166 [Patescibacteria group bacterium]|jgi:hypothetical protein|nr:hypothetical protein [Patescibacteria group bacterium]